MMIDRDNELTIIYASIIIQKTIGRNEQIEKFSEQERRRKKER